MVVRDGERLVGLAFLFHALGPVSHGEMRPVVVALLQLVPRLLQELLPRFVSGQRPQWRSSNLYAVVVIRAIRGGDAQQGVAQLDQLLLQILRDLQRLSLLARPVGALGA